MTYKDMYKSLPAATQKALRELMVALGKCDRIPIVSGTTICQSRLQTATVKVQSCTREVEELARRPVRNI